MRSLLNKLDLLLEADANDTQSLASLKSEISGKIKKLPPDPASIAALREIEDLLANVNAGGRMGIINGELTSITDPSVQEAQKMLARYIISIPMTPAQRGEMFDLWRSDKLVDRKKLLGKGKKTFSDIINKYDSNPAIKELANDLMRIADLGQGKGEFGLSVMSKSINKQVGKGDLLIDGRPIEVKTTDAGAGRFTDQEVRPGPGFEKVASELNAYATSLGFKLVASGISVSQAASMMQDPELTGPEKNKLFKLMTSTIGLIFDGADVSGIMSAIKSGNTGAALQEYAVTNYNYYMDKKKDEGVLYIGLTYEPIMTIFFKDAAELQQAGLRLHAGTAYITSVKDIRLPFPQIEIMATSFGANAAAAAEKKMAKDAAKAARAAKSAAKLAPITPNQITNKRTDIRPPGVSKSNAPAKSAGIGRERR